MNPSPTRTIRNEREFFLAGEGNKDERGQSPLSKTYTPLSSKQGLVS
jgi:hypothetical protein